jgi:hypothetical protein
MTCPLFRSITQLWLTLLQSLLHNDLLARPDQTSFAALCCSLGLNAHRDGAAAPAPFTKGSKIAMIIQFTHTKLCHERISRAGSESAWERASGEQLQGFVVALGSGSDAESAMTWRLRRTRSAAALALPYGYRTPEGSLPNVASRTLTSLLRCR